MNRPTTLAYAVAAIFAIVVIVDLVVRPTHYERTLALAVVLGAVAAGYGRHRSRSA